MKSKTIGKSKLTNPTEYKPDMNVQFWIDRRYIASISRFVEDGLGVRANSLSQLMRHFIGHVVDNFGIDKVETTMEATTILKTRYGANKDFNPKGRYQKNLVNNLLIDDKRILGNKKQDEKSINDAIDIYNSLK